MRTAWIATFRTTIKMNIGFSAPMPYLTPPDLSPVAELADRVDQMLRAGGGAAAASSVARGGVSRWRVIAADLGWPLTADDATGIR
jgi:hypothetical protein